MVCRPPMRSADTPTYNWGEYHSVATVGWPELCANLTMLFVWALRLHWARSFEPNKIIMAHSKRTTVTRDCNLYFSDDSQPVMARNTKNSLSAMVSSHPGLRAVNHVDQAQGCGPCSISRLHNLILCLCHPVLCLILQPYLQRPPRSRPRPSSTMLAFVSPSAVHVSAQPTLVRPAAPAAAAPQQLRGNGAVAVATGVIAGLVTGCSRKTQQKRAGIVHFGGTLQFGVV